MADLKKLPTGEVQYDLDNIKVTVDTRFYDEEPTTVQHKKKGCNLFCSIPWADLLMTLGNDFLSETGRSESFWEFTGDAFNQWFEDSTPMQVAFAVLNGERRVSYGSNTRIDPGIRLDDQWFGFDQGGTMLSFRDDETLKEWLKKTVARDAFLEWFDKNCDKIPCIGCKKDN